MSDQDKQFVDAVSRWRKADEKDVRIAALEAECERLREALGRILENEASDYKAAEEFGGYVLDDELREEARAALGHEPKESYK